ncbi:MAG: UDP-N-acetylmuramoyl-tripeptide--D-alanyl-D-alanine ligase [Bdellovibrionales bacterium]
MTQNTQKAQHASSNVIWTAKDAAIATDGKVNTDWNAYGLSIDSRTVQKGDLFIALKGDADGHDYVLQALEKGAVAAMVSEMPKGCDDQTPLLMVEDTQKALEALGQGARYRVNAKIVAVTGSVGKTGTKELLAQGLGAQGQTHAAQKSFNNHIGVPLTLASMHAGNDFGVFEVGMNHPGEITPLSEQVKPDVALITTVAPVHLEHFEEGIEGIAKAKAEIFEGMKTGSFAVVNYDIETFPILKAQADLNNVKVVTFGKNESADSVLKSCLVAANGTRINASIMGEDIAYSLQWSGEHIAMNSVAALTAIKLAGGDIQKAAKAMSQLQAPAGRGRREYLDIGDENNPVTLIDESYNASPTSMKAAFKVLALIDPGRGGRRIAVLGDMLELGDTAPQKHADLALPIRSANIDFVYTCGSLMKNLHKNLPNDNKGKHCENSSDLAEIVTDVLIPGDVVMVKGSLGSKMNVVVEALRALPNKQKTKQNQKDRNAI